MNRRESAETLALEAFVWLLQSDLSEGFLNATGAVQDQLAAQAQDPLFLGAVLDFLMQEDQRVMAFCDATGRPYPSVMEARALLPGGDLPHWT
ncbi:MAG: DUF3572 domain-containing protein [Cypionkella sp.]